MNLKAILLLVASLSWFAVCHYYYCCQVKGACYGCAAPVEVVAVAPLSFNWSEDAARTSDEFDQFKADIMAKDEGDNILEIVGQYATTESAPEGFENMGLARASKIRALFMDDLPEERIRLSSRTIAGNGANGDSTFLADFKWIKAEIEKSEVVEMSDRTVILFASNSSQKEADPKVDAYLSRIAEELKAADKQVQLIGHTDSQGQAANNLELGRARAQSIRSFLLAKGVPKAKISLESKGQTVPVASNDTEAGRHQNRRVEVRISQQ
ncbi:MAG: OmpA family protein [Bacteroidota bacterium]